MMLKKIQKTLAVTLTALAIGGTFPCHGDEFVSDDARIHYEVSGSGAPLILLHGGLTSSTDMRALIDLLATTYRVIAPDSRKHGLSGDGTQPISYGLMAQDVLNLMQHLGLERASIAGQSDGGITALTAVVMAPEKFNKLVVIGAGFHHRIIPDEAKEYLRTVRWQHPIDETTFPGIYLQDYLKGGRKLGEYQAWFDELAHMWTTAPTFTVEELAAIYVPTLLMSGDHEDVPLDHLREFASALPNASTAIIKDADHFLHQSHTEEAARKINAFLAGN